jgi:hypothetical protein
MHKSLGRIPIYQFRETQGLEVEWGISLGRLGMVGNVGFGRSGRWGRGGNSGSFGTSSFGKGGSQALRLEAQSETRVLEGSGREEAGEVQP